MANLTGYYPPLLSGVLGSQSGQFSPNYSAGPLSQLAYQMAGSPQLGPLPDRGTPPAVPGMSAGATGPGTGGGAGGTALGILSSLAKNPSLVKTGLSSLLGSSLGAYGSGAAADSAVSGALGGVGAQTAGDAAAIQAANDAALSGGGVFGGGGGGAAGGTAASGGSGAALGAGAGAAAAAAIPLALLAAAAFVPDSSELTPDKISQMESEITAATKANGGPLSASYASQPGGYQTLADLMTLESENPTEFAKAGGTGPITQYLQSLGYSPINWSLLGPARLQPASPGRQV